MVAHNIGSVLIKELDEYVGIVIETELTRKGPVANFFKYFRMQE
jgi:hypothetical protein